MCRSQVAQMVTTTLVDGHDVVGRRSQSMQVPTVATDVVSVEHGSPCTVAQGTLTWLIS